jgi:hypothetical protein
MDNIRWLYTKFTDLTWWQMILWGLYTIYFLSTAQKFWEETDRYGLVKGYMNVIFGYAKVFRLYHIVLIIFNIPPAIIGLLFPLIKIILRFKLYEFKQEPEKPKEYEFIVTVSNELIRDSQIVDTSTDEFKEIWNNENAVSEDYEKLTWCDFDKHDVVLGTGYAKSHDEARMHFSQKFDINVKYIRAYMIK